MTLLCGAEVFDKAVVLALAEAAVFYDYRYYKIPNKLIAWGFTAAFTGKLLWVVFYGESAWELLEIPINAMFVMIVLFLMYCVRAIGGGDVKLLAVAGGMLGVREGINVSVTALVVSVLYGVPAMLKRRGIHMHKIHLSYAVFVAVIISILRTQVIF